MDEELLARLERWAGGLMVVQAFATLALGGLMIGLDGRTEGRAIALAKAMDGVSPIETRLGLALYSVLGLVFVVAGVWLWAGGQRARIVGCFAWFLLAIVARLPGIDWRPATCLPGDTAIWWGSLDGFEILGVAAITGDGVGPDYRLGLNAFALAVTAGLWWRIQSADRPARAPPERPQRSWRDRSRYK
jgi:hypothetical protein